MKKDQQKQDDILDLGTWLGRRQAFSAIAGRCSAADAQCLRELRNSKKYKAYGLNWEQCCKQRVGMSRASVEMIIRDLEENGPEFFVLRQATGITSDQYRRIKGAVSGHMLLYAGAEIPIEIESARRLAAAVEELLRAAPAALPAPADDAAELERAFAKAERATRSAIAELDKLRIRPLDVAGRMRLQTMIDEADRELTLLSLQVRS